MQILTYINLMGERAVFGGSPPFVLDHVDGVEGAELTRKTFTGDGQDGAITERVLRNDRKVDATVNLITYGRSDLYRTRIDQLCGVLSAERAFQAKTGARARLVYENDYGTWWTWAVPKGAPKYGKRIQDIFPQMKLSFECDSPFWFAMEEQKGGFMVEESAFHFRLRFPIRFASRDTQAVLINHGHVSTPVRIVLYGEGEKPSLINRTTGQKISLTSPLPTGAVLRINTDPEDLYVRMEIGGQEGNAYGLLDVTTPLSEFSLAPGENAIAYEAGGMSSKTVISLYWRDRFEGV